MEEEKAEEEKKEESVVHEVEVKSPVIPFPVLPLIIGGILIIVSGAVTGYFLSGNIGSPASKKTTQDKTDKFAKGTVVGSDDTKTFRDSAEGALEKGGVDSEGTHHLVRPGGESQNVYLTSSIVDLDQFSGRKIKVWGETNKAKKAGWLMDVGRVEILE